MQLIALSMVFASLVLMESVPWNIWGTLTPGELKCNPKAVCRQFDWRHAKLINGRPLRPGMYFRGRTAPRFDIPVYETSDKPIFPERKVR